MQRLNLYTEQGGVTLTTGGISSSTKVMGVFPGATCSVFNQGTLVLATIYSDNGITLKSNPFTSDSITGLGFFLAANGHYDLQFSGTGFSTFTLADIILNDPADANTLGSLTVTGNTVIGGTLTVTGTTSAGIFSIVKHSRDCRQDGVVANGVTDDSAAINTCIANAKTNKQTTVLLPCGNILATAATINGTNFPGLRISGCGFEADATNPPTQTQGITNIWCNQGITKACLDLTGSGSHEVDHLVLTLFKTGLTGAGMGIIQSRDNAGGGGSANPLCFSEAYNIHDIYITDNGGTSPTLNSNRGFVGIYNVSAENGIYNNIHILADTPMVFSQTNVLGTVSSYQTILTGCPPSMTGVTLVNPVLTGSATTLPLIEANITNGFSLFGYQCVGGSACIKFENTGGATATAGWTVTGITEQSTADILTSSVNMANMHFMMLIASPPPGFVFKPLAANLTFDQCDFLIDDYFSLVPFIDNVQTGTQIRGSKLHIGFATSASNTTLLDSEVFAPTLTDANISFNAASTYMRFTSSGISTVGTFRATQLLSTSNGTLAAPAVGVTTSSTGWFINSNVAWQLTYGGTANCLYNGNGETCGSAQGLFFSSNIDPNNAAADSGISRIAAGVVGAGNGTPGNTSGTFQGSFKTTNLLISATAPTISSGFGTGASIATNNGPASFTVNVGTGGVATNGVIALPTATNGWNCTCEDITTTSATVARCKQTASTASTATIGNFNATPAAAAWVASDILVVSCLAR